MTRARWMLPVISLALFATVIALHNQNRRLTGDLLARTAEAAALQVRSEASEAALDSVTKRAKALVADSLALVRVRREAARLGATLAAVARTAESIARDTTVGYETLRQTILALTRGIGEREAAQRSADSATTVRIEALQAAVLAQAAAGRLALDDAQAAWQAERARLVAEFRARTPTRLQRVTRAGLYFGTGYVVARLTP